VGDKIGCPKLVDSVGGVRHYRQKSNPPLVVAGGDDARGRRYPPWRRP
jgi:hypothetical protein